MLVFYCEYKKQRRVARKIALYGRSPAEQKRCLLLCNNWPLFLLQKTRHFSRVFCRQKRDSLAQSLLDCARRLCRRTLRCTLHYASMLARSRCKANALFLRQAKPKSNTKVLDLGFSFAKIQLYKSSTGESAIFIVAYAIWLKIYFVCGIITKKFGGFKNEKVAKMYNACLIGYFNIFFGRL